MRGIHGERSQDGEDAGVEDPCQLILGIGIEVGPRRERDPGFLEGRRDLLAEGRGLTGHELFDPGPYRPELFDLVEAVG